MTVEEKWQDVAGYEGRYQVSNFGRVKSLSRERCTKLLCQVCPEIILKHRINNNGYVYVYLWAYGKRKKLYIHRLVALMFLEKPNAEADEVNHKNKVRTDNHYWNLEWCNHIDNCAHRDKVF